MDIKTDLKTQHDAATTIWNHISMLPVYESAVIGKAIETLETICQILRQDKETLERENATLKNNNAEQDRIIDADSSLQNKSAYLQGQSLLLQDLQTIASCPEGTLLLAFYDNKCQPGWWSDEANYTTLADKESSLEEAIKASVAWIHELRTVR